MLNWSMRYLPVVRLLDELAAGSVLDVGSGWHGLSAYRPGEVVHTDLRFSGDRPPPDGPGRTEFVGASADRLPFRDNAFDFAISLDLMEHLPSPMRRLAVEELARVATRGVLVGFPAGAVAARTDRRLARWLGVARRPIPDWLDEHLAQPEYPDHSLVVGALPAGWRIVDEIALGNAAVTLAVVLAEQLPVTHRLATLLDRWYRVAGPARLLDCGKTYRRLWLLQPAS